MFSNTAFLVLSLPVLVFAVVFHECAHGWMAEKLGDPTARWAGRITLNPIPHIDIMGTIIIPLILVLTKSPFLFGYAKPVPINYNNLKNPQRDILWIGLSGPLANIILMLISALIWKLILVTSGPLTDYTIFDKFGISYKITQPLSVMVQYSILINMVLAAFNLIPIPPLDGSRIVLGLLPERWAEAYAQLEPYGFLIIMGLFITGLSDYLVGPLIIVMQYLLHLLKL